MENITSMTNKKEIIAIYSNWKGLLNPFYPLLLVAVVDILLGGFLILTETYMDTIYLVCLLLGIILIDVYIYYVIVQMYYARLDLELTKYDYAVELGLENETFLTTTNKQIVKLRKLMLNSKLEKIIVDLEDLDKNYGKVVEVLKNLDNEEVN